MARKSKGTHEKIHIAGKYALGTPEEIDNRAKTGYQNQVTQFVQIPSGGNGRNLNEPPHEDAKGYFKFDHGVG